MKGFLSMPLATCNLMQRYFSVSNVNGRSLVLDQVIKNIKLFYTNNTICHFCINYRFLLHIYQFQVFFIQTSQVFDQLFVIFCCVYGAFTFICLYKDKHFVNSCKNSVNLSYCICYSIAETFCNVNVVSLQIKNWSTDT